MLRLQVLKYIFAIYIFVLNHAGFGMYVDETTEKSSAGSLGSMTPRSQSSQNSGRYSIVSQKIYTVCWNIASLELQKYRQLLYKHTVADVGTLSNNIYIYDKHCCLYGIPLIVTC